MQLDCTSPKTRRQENLDFERISETERFQDWSEQRTMARNLEDQQGQKTKAEEEKVAIF